MGESRLERLECDARDLDQIAENMGMLGEFSMSRELASIAREIERMAAEEKLRAELPF